MCVIRPDNTRTLDLTCLNRYFVVILFLSQAIVSSFQMIWKNHAKPETLKWIFG